MNKMILLFCVLILQAGCATVENDFDPLESTNRSIDGFNTSLDEAVLRPVAVGYTDIVAKPVRGSVTNFFENLLMPNTIINDILQGKVHHGLSDTYRFVVNSTFGILGLFDVASYVGIEPHKEDFGQTLAVWGVGQGAYIVYPVLGSNSVRNTPGTVMSYFLDGATYLFMVMSPEAAIATTALKYVDQRANVEQFVKMRDEMALDAYVFVREGWRQNREYQIYDGNPPVKTQSLEDDEFGDEFEDEGDFE
ncbi:MAG: VacJ family lipoprotein [Ghiorsea sp.]